jgi:WhiB family transcriptional regulator, redox-sensing transcriptional regulator
MLQHSQSNQTTQTMQGVQTWQVRAACRGPQSSIFFPPSSFERKDDKDRREGNAKGICAGCAVRQECLDYAIEIREPHGIWGGLTEGERRVLFNRLAG